MACDICVVADNDGRFGWFLRGLIKETKTSTEGRGIVHVFTRQHTAHEVMLTPGNQNGPVIDTDKPLVFVNTVLGQ